MSDSKLKKEKLLEGLTTSRFGQKLFVFDELDSTNTCARTLADTGIEEGTVVITDYQTAGRGRQGRTWTAERGKNLMFSVVFRPDPAVPLWQFPYLLSEGAARGVEKLTGMTVQTKWPNDLIVNGKKCAGILVEQSATDGITTAIAGIGVNVNQTTFPKDIVDKATSLKAVIGKPVDRIRLFQFMLAALEELYDGMCKDAGKGMMSEWKKRCVTFGRKITFEHGHETLVGTARGLAEDGGLIVDLPSGMKTVYAGEVTISNGNSKPTAE